MLSGSYSIFRERLVEVEASGDAHDLRAKRALVGAIRSWGNRLLQTSGDNDQAALTAMRNLLLPTEAGI